MMNNLNKDQIKNIIIGVAILLLVLGGAYYSKKNKVEPTEENTTDMPEVKGENPNGGTAVPEVKVTPEKPQVEVSTENKTKWGTAMANAGTAFNKQDYAKAVSYYNEALSYNKVDTVYSGLFNTYGAQGDWKNAKIALDNAISLKPTFTDYWTSKLTMMDEKTSATYAEIKKVYEDGLKKVDSKTKVNLVTSMARIAESNGQVSDAVALFTYAKELYPANANIYQKEADRLNATK